MIIWTLFRQHITVLCFSLDSSICRHSRFSNLHVGTFGNLIGAIIFTTPAVFYEQAIRSALMVFGASLSANCHVLTASEGLPFVTIHCPLVVLSSLLLYLIIDKNINWYLIANNQRIQFKLYSIGSGFVLFLCGFLYCTYL